MKYLDTHPEAGAVASPARRIDAAGRIFVLLGSAIQRPKKFTRSCYSTVILPHTTLMIRHDLLKQLGGYRTTVHANDYDLLWRLSQISEIHTLPEPVAYYRSDNTDKNRITMGQASQQLIGSQIVSLQAATAFMNGRHF